ncbi:golgin subfamily A member 6-like protein 22 [Macrobrachium rosenbergii]|uniref:golgin subfamily A member 6-like protein 22 n=1 Tax=Macrobrachium rosenbergii TaxID=79674 RepID=UPI0034D5D100
MYSSIEEEINKAEENSEKVMILGDFNCKIGKIIANNKEEVTKGGKELLKLIRQNKLMVINNHRKCKGTWTRIQNTQKSIIDYVMIKEDDEEGIQIMEIDETKEITPYRISSELVHSDHCAVRVVMNWRLVWERSRKKKYRVDIKKLKECRDRQALVDIAREKGDIKKKYTKWQTELDKILSKCMKRCKEKKERKTKVLRDLMRARRRIKRENKKSRSTEEKRLRQVQERLISEYIIREKRKEDGIRIKETAAEIKSKGGVNGAAFWDFFKKKLDGTKSNNMVAIKNKEGKIIENVKEIRREYEQYYKDLFILDKPEDKVGKLAEEINIQYQKWMSLGGTRKTEKIQIQRSRSIQEVERAVSKLKNKYTPDSQGINNIMIKSMGTEMTESLALLIGQIEEELNTHPRRMGENENTITSQKRKQIRIRKQERNIYHE